MRIDEFEFRDTKGNEIEPTKNQFVIYIKSLHKQIKDLQYENKVMRRALELMETEYNMFLDEVGITKVDNYTANTQDFIEIAKKEVSKDES